MLAKAPKRVNGKCVLLCTIEETYGSKITIMTTSHFPAPDSLPGKYLIINMMLIWNARLTLLHVYQAPYNSYYLLGAYAYEALQEHRHFREYVFPLLGEEVRE